MYRNHYCHANYGVDVTRPYYYPHHVNMVDEYMYDGEFGHHDQSLEHMQNPPFPADHFDYSPLPYPSTGFSKTDCVIPIVPESLPTQNMFLQPHKRKHKSVSLDMDIAEEEENLSVDTMSPTMVSLDLHADASDPRKHYKQNHSEIEKRRRDKMNLYISELSAMIPMCNAMNRKLDKLSVLRMAVQHMKSIKSSKITLAEVKQKNSYISDYELKRLILGIAEGFMFVVGCDRGRILYVSESVKSVLNFAQTELVGQSLFDILHPRDINKVKEQLCAFDITPRERLIDAKTMNFSFQPVLHDWCNKSRAMMPLKAELQHNTSNMCPGARRSFFCRIKCGDPASAVTDTKINIKQDLESYILNQQKVKNEHKNFVMVQCTGYMKSWSEAKLNLDDDGDCEPYDSNLNCLVAIGRVIKMDKSGCDHSSYSSVRSMEFSARHSVEGKFTNVDDRATFILGYLPQELLGTALYEYYHADDIISMADFQRKVLESKVNLESGVYRFRCKDGSYIHLKSTYKCFQNPWTKETDFILSTNVVVQSQDVSSSGQAMDEERFVKETVKEPLSSVCTASRSAISPVTHQLPDSNKNGLMDAVNSTMNIDASPLSTHFSSQNMSPETIGVSAAPLSEMITPREQDVAKPNSSISVGPPDQAVCLTETFIPEQVADDIQQAGHCWNDEEALASFFMSLLEADGGLGEPADFDNFPWAL